MPPDMPLSQSILALQYRIKNLERDLKRARDDKQEAESDAAQALEQVESLTGQNNILTQQLQGVGTKSQRTESDERAVLSTSKPAGILTAAFTMDTDNGLESTETQGHSLSTSSERILCNNYGNVENRNPASETTDSGSQQVRTKSTQATGDYKHVFGQGRILGDLGPLPRIRSQPVNTRLGGIASGGESQLFNHQLTTGISRLDIDSIEDEQRDSTSSLDLDDPNLITIHGKKHQARSRGSEDKSIQTLPTLEEAKSLIEDGIQTHARLRSTSITGLSNATNTEALGPQVQINKQLGTRMTEPEVTKSYTTALTSKPRIPTSREVLARRTSEEEVEITKINEEAMRGPMADMYFGRRPKIPDDFRVPGREETARLEAEQEVRLRARHAQRQADQREKDRHQKVTISATLDTNPVTFRSDSTGSTSPVPNPNTAHEPEDSRSTGLKRKAEAASMYMADTSKKRRPDSEHPPS